MENSGGTTGNYSRDFGGKFGGNKWGVTTNVGVDTPVTVKLCISISVYYNNNYYCRCCC